MSAHPAPVPSRDPGSGPPADTRLADELVQDGHPPPFAHGPSSSSSSSPEHNIDRRKSHSDTPVGRLRETTVDAMSSPGIARYLPPTRSRSPKKRRRFAFAIFCAILQMAECLNRVLWQFGRSYPERPETAFSFASTHAKDVAPGKSPKLG